MEKIYAFFAYKPNSYECYSLSQSGKDYCDMVSYDSNYIKKTNLTLSELAQELDFVVNYKCQQDEVGYEELQILESIDGGKTYSMWVGDTYFIIDFLKHVLKNKLKY